MSGSQQFWKPKPLGTSFYMRVDIWRAICAGVWTDGDRYSFTTMRWTRGGGTNNSWTNCCSTCYLWRHMRFARANPFFGCWEGDLTETDRSSTGATVHQGRLWTFVLTDLRSQILPVREEAFETLQCRRGQEASPNCFRGVDFRVGTTDFYLYIHGLYRAEVHK